MAWIKKRNSKMETNIVIDFFPVCHPGEPQKEDTPAVGGWVRTASPFCRSQIEGNHPINTSLTETPASLHIASLAAPGPAQPPIARAGPWRRP